MILPTLLTMLLACGDAESETTKPEATEPAENSKQKKPIQRQILTRRPKWHEKD